MQSCIRSIILGLIPLLSVEPWSLLLRSQGLVILILHLSLIRLEHLSTFLAEDSLEEIIRGLSTWRRDLELPERIPAEHLVYDLFCSSLFDRGIRNPFDSEPHHSVLLVPLHCILELLCSIRTDESLACLRLDCVHRLVAIEAIVSLGVFDHSHIQIA